MEMIFKYLAELYVISLIVFLVLGFFFKTYCQYKILKKEKKIRYASSYALFLFDFLFYEYSLNVYLWLACPYYYEKYGDDISDVNEIVVYKNLLKKYNKIVVFYAVTIPLYIGVFIWFANV